MNKRRRPYDGLTLFAGGISAALVIITLIIGMLSWQAQKRLDEQRYDYSGIAVVQIRLHYEILTGIVRGLESGANGFSSDAANVQYDILYERLKSLPYRPPYVEILDEEVLGLVQGTFEKFAALAPTFDAMADGEQPPLTDVLKVLISLRPNIERIAGKTVQLAPILSEEKRQQNKDGLLWLMIAVSALVISSGIFALMLWQSLQRESQRSDELALARDEAVRANETKSSFLAQMSHELRTPLNAIIGFSEMIVSKVHGPLDEHYIGYATDVRNAGRRLLHLINELLDLAKIEAGRLDLHCTEVPFSTLTKTCISVTSTRANASGVKVEVNDRTTDPVYCDEMKMSQVLINLVDNAIKFSPEGSTVTIDAAHAPDGWLEVRVQDHGCGIAENELAKVMEPFGQIEPRRARVSNPGVGLGLPIVKALIELHGGSIEMKSTVGEGTTVSMRFPPKPAA